MSSVIGHHPKARVDLADLVARLAVHWSACRCDGDHVVMLAGPNGHIKPVGGDLVVTLKPAAAAKRWQFEQLDDAGLLVPGEAGDILIGKLPDEIESRWLREFLGLHRDNGGNR
jgi:hypothetical protein